MDTRVKKDGLTASWRVVCPVHGELGRYRNFWPANRDARQHDETCGADEEVESAGRNACAPPVRPG